MSSYVAFSPRQRYHKVRAYKDLNTRVFFVSEYKYQTIIMPVELHLFGMHAVSI